ncbi:MAG: rRNA pseudouridine synthase [Thermotogota bacterium]|nr:rRNA pseudouridine synthase [Thermotogota bacterium]MDK2864002.1 rRNA pseudouridine synthase [Thermotogota bacterium]HCZ06535.1 RluA family pseudouridine synthase [Thermotogota bacterium]
MKGSEIFKELEVETESRLDRFLRKHYPQLKLASIYKLLKKGWVRVNQKRVKDPSYRLTPGDKVFVAYTGNVDHMIRSDTREMKPAVMDLDILYEDENYIALAKRAGVSVHPGKNTTTPTLVEGLLFYGQKKGFKPYLVHRLDKHTSGVLLVCKNEESAKLLSSLLKKREVKKRYTTLVFGKTKEKGYIEQPLNGQDALTVYQRIDYFSSADVSLLSVDIKTGRKHQIRRHLSLIGHPVVGDNHYGDRSRNRWFKKNYGLKRYFLHCSQLSFVDPRNGKRFEFHAPLSKDLEETLKKLGDSS